MWECRDGETGGVLKAVGVIRWLRIESVSLGELGFPTISPWRGQQRFPVLPGVLEVFPGRLGIVLGFHGCLPPLCA